MARTERAQKPPVRPIAHLSLVDRVTDELYRAIINGDIEPGAAVSIVELCDLFGVSHIPVREALRRLESEGLISLRPARSALVAPVSAHDLASVFRLRRLTEGDLVLRVMDAMTEDRLSFAASAVDDFVKAEPTPAALAGASHAFRVALLGDDIEAVERRVLEIIWRSADRYLHLRMTDPASAADFGATWTAESGELLDVARRGSGPQMRDAWLASLDRMENDLLAGLNSDANAAESSNA